MVKKGKLNKAPGWALLKNLSMRYTDLLVEVKFQVVCHHFPDDSDKLAGTMSQGIVVSPDFRHLYIVVRFEDGVILYNVVSCIYQGIAQHFGATLWHLSPTGLKVTRLIYRRVKTRKGKQLTRTGETVNIT